MSESDLREAIKHEDARVKLASGELRAIDLRDTGELSDGHVPGAVPVGERSLTEAAEEVLAVDEVPILVIGADGEASERGAEELREAGFDATALKGGWKKWVSAGMPVQPRDDQEYEGPDLAQPGQA